MKELWPLEYNKYIFLFYGETLPVAAIDAFSSSQCMCFLPMLYPYPGETSPSGVNCSRQHPMQACRTFHGCSMDQLLRTMGLIMWSLNLILDL